MSRFQNEVRQAKQKHDKYEGNTKTDLHKSNKRHKPDKRQPFSKGLRSKTRKTSRGAAQEPEGR
ncbi:hypothetical protein JHK87_022220 [Glycine soja]|nr:hypothetical protein JHK87_022220 [Glycine soja]